MNISLWEGVLVLKEVNLEMVNYSETDLAVLLAYQEGVCYLVLTGKASLSQELVVTRTKPTMTALNDLDLQ